MHSGFVTVVGRPNVGKSTLVNRMVGTKVAIPSPRPNTTRHSIRGVLHRPDAQVVFVDTPGLHKPRTALGERLNETAGAALDDIDVVVAVLDATAAVGTGDRMVLERSLRAARHPGASLMVVVNKVDHARPAQVVAALTTAVAAVEELAPDDAAGVEYYPVSAATGQGVDPLVEALVALLPEGPPYFPTDMVSDVPEALWVAELVREQLLLRARDELPHSIAVRVTEWEWPRIRCEILVERDSQKGIVIGKGGEILKEVGIAARAQLPEGCFLELAVKVEKRWQMRDDALDRLGY